MGLDLLDLILGFSWVGFNLIVGSREFDPTGLHHLVSKLSSKSGMILSFLILACGFFFFSFFLFFLS